MEAQKTLEKNKAVLSKRTALEAWRYLISIKLYYMLIAIKTAWHLSQIKQVHEGSIEKTQTWAHSMVSSRNKCNTTESDILHVGERVPCSGCLPALFPSPSLALSIPFLSSDSHTTPGTCHFLFLSVENQVSAIWVVLTPSQVCH